MWGHFPILRLKCLICFSVKVTLTNNPIHKDSCGVHQPGEVVRYVGSKKLKADSKIQDKYGTLEMCVAIFF